MLNPEQLIRERAYHLWMQEGCPEGRADHHWHLAHQEVVTSLRPAAPARRKRAPGAKRAAALQSAPTNRKAGAKG
jgi:hypothetical protein